MREQGTFPESTTSLMFRKAGLQDTEALTRLYEEARQFMKDSGNATQWPGPYPAVEDVLKDIGQGVLWADDRREAVMALIPGPDPTYETIDGAWPDDDPYLVIHRIAVRPGSGKGTALIRFAKEKGRQIRIDTHEDNQPMKRLLQKEGFRYCGTIICASGGLREAWVWKAD